jgi:hypothetical protein
MKHVIVTTENLKRKDIRELENFLGEKVRVIKTRTLIKPKFNPYFNKVWGDFDFLRTLFKDDAYVKCYCTSRNKLRSVGIKGHIGMYDLVKKDSTHYFYIGLPILLDKRAKKNGFKSNLAWLYIHELLHGGEKTTGAPDRVHEMQKQGRLKELYSIQYEK